MISAHPRLAVAAGAVAVSATAIFVDLAGCPPGTASFYRCVLALPLLLPLAGREARRERQARGTPPLGRRELLTAGVAGVLFAGDMLLWTQAIFDVGAGISTVIVNVQVIVVPLLALAIVHPATLREKHHDRAAGVHGGDRYRRRGLLGGRNALARVLFRPAARRARLAGAGGGLRSGRRLAACRQRGAEAHERVRVGPAAADPGRLARPRRPGPWRAPDRVAACRIAAGSRLRGDRREHQKAR